jgi:hypothetical protein
MATLDELQQARKNALIAGRDADVSILDYAIAKQRTLPAQQQNMPSAIASMVSPEEIIPPRTQQPSLGEQALGAAETAATVISGATGGTAGMLGGTLKGLAREMVAGEFGTQAAANRIEQTAMEASGALTYQPRTEAGQQMTQAVMEPVMAIAPALGPIAGTLAPAAAMVRPAAPYVRAATTATTRAASDVSQVALQHLRDSLGIVARDTGETGAPGAAGAPQMGGFGADSAGAARLSSAQERLQRAASMPVPLSLTKGAAERSAELLAFEKEQIKNPALGGPFRERAELNNRQILQNIEALIDETGAALSDRPAMGRSVTSALLTGYDQMKNRVRSAYQAANASAGAREIVDVAKRVAIPDDQGGLQQATVFDYLNAIPENLPSTGVPDAAKSFALKLGLATKDESGAIVPAPGTTVRQWEQWRQEVARSVGTEPADKMYVTMIKNGIDDTLGDLGGKPYQMARALRKQMARKFENRGIVANLVETVKGRKDPKIAANEVYQKTIAPSSPEEVRFLKRVLMTTGPEGQQAWAELQGATLRELYDVATKNAGRDSSGNPIVSPAQLNQRVRALDSAGLLDEMFGKKRAEIIRDLNELSLEVSTSPPGTLINNSGTSMSILTALAEAGTTGVLTGLPVPALSILKAASGAIKNNRLKARIARHLKP